MHVTVSYGSKEYGTGPDARRYTRSVSVGHQPYSPDRLAIEFRLDPPVSGKSESMWSGGTVSQLVIMLAKDEAAGLAKDLRRMCDRRSPGAVTRTVIVPP